MSLLNILCDAIYDTFTKMLALNGSFNIYGTFK